MEENSLVHISQYLWQQTGFILKYVLISSSYFPFTVVTTDDIIIITIISYVFLVKATWTFITRLTHHHLGGFKLFFTFISYLHTIFLRAPLIPALKVVGFDPVTRCIMKTSLMKSLFFLILFNMSIWCLLHQCVLTPRCRQRLQSCQLSHPLSSLLSFFYIYKRAF